MIQKLKKELLLLSALVFGLFFNVNIAAQEAIGQETTEKALVEGSKKASFDSLIEFNKLATEQKVDWMNFQSDQYVQKFALINKIHKDWSDFHNEQMTKLNNLTDWSDAAKETFFKEKLEGAIKLYKEQGVAWENFAKNEQESAKKLCDKHKADFAAKFEPKKAEIKNEKIKTDAVSSVTSQEKNENSQEMKQNEAKPSNSEEYQFDETFDDTFDEDAELE